MNASTSRDWPASRRAMLDIVEHLYALGARHDEIVHALDVDFTTTPGCAHVNVTSVELVRLGRRPWTGMHLHEDECVIDTAARRRKALNLLGELIAHGVLPTQQGDALKIETRGERVAPLPKSLTDRIAQYADELYALAAMSLSRSS